MIRIDGLTLFSTSGRAHRLSAMCLGALLLILSGCRDDSVSQSNLTQAAEQSPAAEARTVEVRIRTASDEQRRFWAELAVTPEAQTRGLTGRARLAHNAAMLFPFPYPKNASFWMKDTPIALDLLFVRPDGTIAAILEGKPNSLEPLFANEPVSAVLEIDFGRSQALGFKVGDKVEWGDCRTAPAASEAWRADRFCPAPSQ